MTEASTSTPQFGPPRARLAFRVGTVGHRPNRLQQADLSKLAETLHDLLAFVKKSAVEFAEQRGGEKLYTDEPPLLRAVSSLAEGADRLFAEQALTLGYALCCPMPFPQGQYENDFKPGEALENESLEHFRELLDRARQDREGVTFELDGERSNSGEAYAAAGRVVLNQSDLLIVVWDGGEPAGVGGTAQTMREAFERGMPLLCVSADALPDGSHCWMLPESESDVECLNKASQCDPESCPPPPWLELRKLILKALSPPSREEAGESTTKQRRLFFSERNPRFNFFFVWKIFRDLVVSGKLRLPAIRVPNLEEALDQHWDPDAPAVAGWVNRRLRAHYAWSDQPADLYADRYRSTFVAAYLLAALAVLFALWPLTAHWPYWIKVGCTAFEFICVASTVGLVLCSFHWAWHDRWMQYRLLAELIRQLRLLVPLGGGHLLPHLPSHLAAYGDPRATWMAWHLRSIARATGLPSARVDTAYIGQILDYLAGLVKEQRDFHEITQHRAESIESRLRVFAFVLFVITALFIGIHLLLYWLGVRLSHDSTAWFALVCAFLPALGAILHGINNQGEFTRIAKRSKAMCSHLKLLLGDIERVSLTSAGSPSRVKLKHVRPLAERAANLMVEELLDWQVIFLDRPPEWP